MHPYCVTVVFLVLALVSAREGSACPKIISRAAWRAAPPTSRLARLNQTPPFVVVHHSATGSCNNERSCAAEVKSIQNYHRNTKKWGDIGYNFLIGGDGSIFEGRGWGVIGAHAIGYNSRSIGICLLGNFMNGKPSAAQENALKNLIACGAQGNRFQKNYRLIGHREVSSTQCPGNYLFQFIQKLGHFDSRPH